MDIFILLIACTGWAFWLADRRALRRAREAASREHQTVMALHSEAADLRQERDEAVGVSDIRIRSEYALVAERDALVAQRKDLKRDLAAMHTTLHDQNMRIHALIQHIPSC